MITRDNYDELLLEYEAIKNIIYKNKLTKEKFVRELNDLNSPLGEKFRRFFDKISTPETKDKEILEFLEIMFK